MKLIPYSFNVSEEIARWTFEVFIQRNSKEWWIAFTNPTAGPWKTITAVNVDGVLDEVYRFTREEDRPDIVLVNDKTKVVFIVEAKDLVSKLLNTKQMDKSIKVIEGISNTLKGLSHQTWKKRLGYSVLPGFLWFSNNKEKAETDNDRVVEFYKQRRGRLGLNKLADPLNIIIVRKGEDLNPLFISKGKFQSSLYTT